MKAKVARIKRTASQGIIGGLAGAKLTYVLPRKVIRAVFCALMLYCGTRLLLS